MWLLDPWAWGGSYRGGGGCAHEKTRSFKQASAKYVAGTLHSTVTVFRMVHDANTLRLHSYAQVPLTHFSQVLRKARRHVEVEIKSHVIDSFDIEQPDECCVYIPRGITTRRSRTETHPSDVN